MGNFLHKLGASAFRHPWRVILIWIVIIAGVGLGAVHFYKPGSTSVSIPGTEAQLAIDKLQTLFPKTGAGSGRIVFETNNGKKVADEKAQIDKLLADVGTVDGVEQTVSPFLSSSFISSSGTIAYAQIQLKDSGSDIAPATLTAIESKVQSARSSDLTIETGGDLVSKAPGEFVGPGELAGVLVALVVLTITLGSLVAAGLSITTALISVATSMAALFSLSQVIDINSTTPVLAIMLGLAVGIDYSLFIINKYKANLNAGYGFVEAAGRAIGTAGNAVVFAAITVIIALSALSIVNIPFMTTMGLAGAGSVAIAALIAITLVPALLRLVGAKAFSKKARAKIAVAHARHNPAEEHEPENTFWFRWGNAIARHPIIILVVAVVALGVIALPARSLTLGLPSDQYAAPDASARKAYDLLSKGFGVGFNAPLTIVVEGLPAVSDADREVVRAPALAQYNQQVASAQAAAQSTYAQALAKATTPAARAALMAQVAEQQKQGQAQQTAALAKIEASVAQYAKLVQLSKVADAMKGISNVQSVTPAIATDDGTSGLIQLIPKSAPADQATKDLITHLRDASVQHGLTNNTNLTLGVTGAVALQGDINAKLGAALPEYLAVVVGLSLVLLIIAFRSILVPIKATLGFLLSILAMFGALVAVFQWGWFGIVDAPGPIISFIPIIATGIIFGLAMDYEFFLVSSMHEAYSHTKKARESVIHGFGVGSKVVTAAGIIMISVFAGFIFNHDSIIRSIGFGLAFGILVDAFVVRMTIVPAAMILLGKAAWWIPKWLDRILPHVSIEGEDAEKPRT